MNARSESIILSPKGTLESCAKFAIDDPETPFIFRRLEIEGEGEYIFSGYVKADMTATLKIGDQTVSVTTDWQKIEVMLTLSTDKLFLYFGTATNFYLYHPVLVAGKIAHRWISHPDDFSAVETRLYQTEEGLKSTVKKGSIISEINQTAEEVGIKANKINLNGTVTANNNFKILEDGSIEAKNGVFRGDIRDKSGNNIVNKDGVMTQIVFKHTPNYNSYGNFTEFGFFPVGANSNGTIFHKMPLKVAYVIPATFEVITATLFVTICSSYWKIHNIYGFPHTLSLYQEKFESMYQEHQMLGSTDSGQYDEMFSIGSQIAACWEDGQSGWYPACANGYYTDAKRSRNLSDIIKSGSFGTISIGIIDSVGAQDIKECEKRTGLGFAYLAIDGRYTVT